MATNTQSEYVTPIVFPRQKRLRERAKYSIYTYIACLLILELARVLSNFETPGTVFRFLATFDTVPCIPNYDTVKWLKDRRLILQSSHTNSDLAFGFQGSDKDLNNIPTNIITKKNSPYS
jgi:hypothetical protein